MFHVEQPILKTQLICPACGHDEHVTYLELRDYFLSQDKFRIIKCTNCGLLITDPQPLPNEISKYYKSDLYFSHTTHKKGLEFFLYDRIRKVSLTRKVDMIRNFSGGNNLLDIGCATGMFLKECKEHGFQVKGVEPNKEARKYAKEVLKLDVEDLDHLYKLQEESFDVITMWHVLEHVHDLNERMRMVYSLLKNDGVAIVALPNPESYDALFYSSHWAAFDVPRHLYHFSSDSFKSICEKYDFKVIKIRPLIYDAFYISYLSERYKYGKSSYLKALYRGLVSNFRARKAGMNYSSLIYILKKSK